MQIKLLSRTLNTDHLATFMKSALIWQIVAFLFVIVSVVLTMQIVKLSGESHVEIWVAELSGDGEFIKFDHASKYSTKSLTPELTTKIKISEISGFVSNLRTVTADGLLQRKFIDNVYAHLINNDPAYTQTTDWFLKNDPFNRASETLIDVSILSIIQLTADSYQVEWLENEYARIDGSKIEKRFRGAFTVYSAIGVNLTFKTAVSNPMQYYIKSYNFSEIER